MVGNTPYATVQYVYVLKRIPWNSIPFESQTLQFVTLTV